MRVENIKQFSLSAGKHKINSTNKTYNNQTFVPQADLRFLNISAENFIVSCNINFLGLNRAPDDFVLKKVYGLHCPCCGGLMLTKKQAQTNVARIGDKKGEDLRKELAKGYRFYRPNEEEIVNILIEDSNNNPDMDLLGLVKLEAPKGKLRLEAEQKKILKKLLSESKNLSPEKQLEFKQVIDDASRQIEESNENGFFQRKAFIQKINDTINDGQIDDELLKNINDIAEAMPNSLTSKDAFFVKYSRRTNKDIAERLCSPAVVTTEHIQPQSKDGKDNTDNYIPLCGDCNSKRGATPYNEWFLEHPEMPENLQNYINTIYYMLKEGRFEDYPDIDNNYLNEVIEAIKKATLGELILKLPEDSLDTPDEQEIEETLPDEKPLTLDEQREKWLDSHNVLLSKVADFKKTYNELKDDEEFLNIKAYVRVSEKLKTAAHSRGEAQNVYSAAKRSEGCALRNLDAVQKDKRRIGELKEAQARAELTKSAAGEAEIAYKAALARYNDVKAEFDAIKIKIKTPDELNSRIREIKSCMTEYTSLKEAIMELKKKLSEEDVLIMEAGRINAEIAQLKEEMKLLSEKLDFDSEESVSSKEEYTKLSAQRHIFDNINMSHFRSAFPGSSIAPDFILEDSKAAAEERFNTAIENNSFIRYYFVQDEINSLNAEKDALNHEIDQINENKKSLKQTYVALKKFKGEMSYQSLKAKLEELAKRKSEVEFKFENTDIEDKIKRASDRANEILQKYCESFES